MIESVMARGDVPIPEGPEPFDSPARLSSRKEFVDEVPHEVIFSAPQEKSDAGKETAERDSNERGDRKAVHFHPMRRHDKE